MAIPSLQVDNVPGLKPSTHIGGAYQNRQPQPRRHQIRGITAARWPDVLMEDAVVMAPREETMYSLA